MELSTFWRSPSSALMFANGTGDGGLLLTCVIDVALVALLVELDSRRGRIPATAPLESRRGRHAPPLMLPNIAPRPDSIPQLPLEPVRVPPALAPAPTVLSLALCCGVELPPLLAPPEPNAGML